MNTITTLTSPASPDADSDTLQDIRQDQEIMQEFEEAERKQRHPINPRAGQSITRRTPVPVNYRDFLFDPGAEPEPEQTIYDRLMAAGDLVLWLGREKHRKTTLLLQMAICTATGRDFLNFHYAAGEPVKVLFIDYESKTLSLKKRYDAVVKALGLNDEEEKLLQKNLEIVEVRRIRSQGKHFPRFPVKPGESPDSDTFWRTLASGKHRIVILDPMRCVHAQDENDSNIESLLSRLREVFANAGIIISHHMRKRGEKDADLLRDMRAWSDCARGSGAIKAHSDVIVSQEQRFEAGAEVVYLGAFMKDGPDIEPLALEETDAESFTWKLTLKLPDNLRAAFNDLRKAGGKFSSKSNAAEALTQAGLKRSTAFNRVNALKDQGALVNHDGSLSIQDVEFRPDPLEAAVCMN
jgi:RecA-family ATPase